NGLFLLHSYSTGSWELVNSGTKVLQVECTAVKNTVIDGSSRMMGNYQVRFQEEGEGVIPSPYSTSIVNFLRMSR
ncbi:MAG: hypothetical protein MJZ38_06315, partial [archaeon]|nr:hypothetical protein [archaeon]